MADSDPPRFFKVFISRFYSDSLHIPISYYDQLPHPLPRTAILQGNGGCIWKVLMKEMQDEVHFTQGWSKFVEDNSLVDGDFMTFVYNGDCVFEVSVYDGRTACKVIRAVDTEAEDVKDDDIYTLSSSSSSSSSKDTDSASESETRANVILRSKNKGKSKVEDVEESDDEENSDDHLTSEDTDETFSESKMSKAITCSRDKGKKKVVEESDEGNDSDDEDYVEAFGGLDVEESSNKSDTFYSPDSEDTASYMKNPKKKGKSKRREDVDSVSDNPDSSEPKTKRGKVDPRIKDPERFLADPKNIHFETILKNRKHELLVHAQIVRDYELKFEPTIHYIDNHKDGKLQAKAIKWADQRVCIKKWKRICERNKVKEKDAILCELFRKRRTVYAVRIHIVREKDL